MIAFSILVILGFSYLASVIANFNFWVIVFFAVTGFNLAVMAIKDFQKMYKEETSGTNKSTSEG